MAEYKTIRIDVEAYDLLVEMARKNGRTIIGQLRVMLDAFGIMNIQSVSTLPRPDDGVITPVINVIREDIRR